MSVERRRFLQLASLISTTAVTGAAVAARASANASPSMLTCSEFERCVGDTFIFEKAVFGEVTARLAAVDAHPGSRSASDREGRFNLRFETKGDGVLEQASYRVHHPRLGDFVMFVSPKDAKCATVEAVFNRL
jgi:hypothetical protein